MSAEGRIARFRDAAWRRALATSLVCAGLVFIAALAWKHRVEIMAQLADLDLILALAATTALLVSNVGMALVFSELVREETIVPRGGGARLVGTFLLSQIAKYIPGRVWTAVLQGAAVGPQLSIQRLVRINVDVALMAAAVTGGAALAFIAWAMWGAWAGLLMLALTVTLASFVMVQRPSIRLHAILGRMVRRLREVDGGTRTRSAAPTARGLTGVLLFVSGYCVGWLMLVLSVMHGPVIEALRLVAMLSASYLVGLLSMLPAGLGVREAFLVASTAWVQVDMASVTLLAIVTRLAMVLVDLLSLPLAATLLFYRRRSPTGARS